MNKILVFFTRIGLQFSLLYFVGLQVICADDYLRVWVASTLLKQWIWFPDAIFLPSFFWIYSIPLRLGIPVRLASIGLTMILASGVSVLTYLLSLRLGISKRTAFWGTLLISFQPLHLWLGGVPLSETLGACFILVGFLFWLSSTYSIQIVGSFLLGLATLVRYEFWIVVIGLGAARFWLYPLMVKKNGILALISCFGIFSYAFWRLSTPKPFSPAQFVFQEVTNSVTSSVHAQQTLYGLFAFCTLGAISIFLFPFTFRFIKSSPSAEKLFLIFCGSTLLSTLLFFGVGYFPVTFSMRMVYFPTLLTSILLLKWIDPKLHFFSKPLKIFIPTILIIQSSVFSFFPPIEVKEETIEVAHKLQILLKTIPTEQIILAEKKDLGWTTLWGFTDGNPRLIFDRNALSQPPQMNQKGWLTRKLLIQSNTACVLTASLQTEKVVESELSAEWKKEWQIGKYTLFCIGSQD